MTMRSRYSQRSWNQWACEIRGMRRNPDPDPDPLLSAPCFYQVGRTCAASGVTV